MKKWMVLFLCFAVVFPLAACGAKSAGEPAQTDQLPVSVTFDAMAEFTKAVGGDKVEISTIIPDGTEPHEFEPKAQDLKALSDAKVFVYNGFGMETWVDDAVAAADNPNLVVVEASKGASPITNTDEAEIAEHGQYDPHLWLSLKGAETESQNICDGLSEADPNNAEYYQKNCDAFVSQLEDLYQEYAEKFQSADQKSIVTGHAAFAYFCRDFGLTQNSVEDVFAEGEPTAQQLAKLVEYCREQHVKTIFAEELASPDVSKTLADEVGAAVKTIYTIESSENGESYVERMTSNLSEICSSLT